MFQSWVNLHGLVVGLMQVYEACVNAIIIFTRLHCHCLNGRLFALLDSLFALFVHLT